MKFLNSAIVAAVLATATPATAQVLDLANVKCREFLQSGPENISYILMWMQGFYTTEDDPPIINFDKMKADAAKLSDFCSKNPETGLITAADDLLN